MLGRILCQEPKPPPDNVPALAPPASNPNAGIREQMAVGLPVTVDERLPHFALETDELLDVVLPHADISPNVIRPPRRSPPPARRSGTAAPRLVSSNRTS